MTHGDDYSNDWLKILLLSTSTRGGIKVAHHASSFRRQYRWMNILYGLDYIGNQLATCGSCTRRLKPLPTVYHGQRHCAVQSGPDEWQAIHVTLADVSDSLERWNQRPS